MRIVGGKFRGRPRGAGARGAPYLDRVREAVFNILAHGIEEFSLDGLKVLDLFAGTGALGLEALSRGTAFCLFVEEDAEARGLIRRNVEAFGLTGVTKIFRRDATDLGDAGNRGDAGLVFLDPPTHKGSPSAPSPPRRRAGGSRPARLR
jgi:16S rRNA (guanine966-N2)-methyltransferase